MYLGYDANSSRRVSNINIPGSLSCPLHSEIRYYIFGSDRDMGFNPRKKKCTLHFYDIWHSGRISLSLSLLLSLKTTLLSWH